MNGIRLKLARTGAGLSLRDLASVMQHQVTAQAIGKYEREEATPSPEVLVSLADSLNTSVDYLSTTEELSLQEIKFRKEAFVSKKVETRVKAEVLVALERYLKIERVLDLSSVNWNEPRNKRFPIVDDLHEAERAADALRLQWNLGQEPLPSLVELLEERGVKVVCLPLGSVSGFSAKAIRENQPDVPVIVINSQHPGDRQRFTAAHELGNLVMAISPNINSERASYRFAGAFLMPAATIWLKVGSHRKAVDLEELLLLKERFRVSVQALVHRFHELSIVSNSTYISILDELKRLGWSSPPYVEECPIPSEEPTRFRRLCMRAVAEEAISESEARELLVV